MAVLALNLMHDLAPTGRHVRRAPIASWMATALGREGHGNLAGSAPWTENDVLGHGLPKSHVPSHREVDRTG
ncbi:MAG TPA: hypothetical protein VFW95_07550 [Candidatus Limnocylindria bacterium]|nr:hypothetical protein [Candidatus Limnocylindria bacterium]